MDERSKALAERLPGGGEQRRPAGHRALASLAQHRAWHRRRVLPQFHAQKDGKVHRPLCADLGPEPPHPTPRPAVGTPP